MTDGKQELLARVVALLEGGAGGGAPRSREAASGVPGPRPLSVWFAPGRIEVFGKHTDYGGGRSLLAAVDRGVLVAAAPWQGPGVEAVSEAGARVVVRPGETGPPDSRAGARAGAPSEPGWAVYLRTVVRRIHRDFPDLPALGGGGPGLGRAASGARGGGSNGAGVRLAFAGDLPVAAGLSSSSALVVAMFRALADAWGLPSYPPAAHLFDDPARLAAYLGAVETGAPWGPFAGEEGVGVHGGSEDHAALVLGRAGHLLQCAFVPLRVEGQVSLPVDWHFVVATSGVQAEKTGATREAYNRLSAELRAVGEAWRAAGGRATTAGGALLEEGASGADLVRAARDHPPSGWDGRGLARRAEQFAAETLELVPAGAAAAGARDAAAFGAAAERSAEFGAAALDNQIPETLHLASSAGALGAAAASPFGAGFGGAVWALVRGAAADAESFAAAWRAEYLHRFPAHAGAADFFRTRPSAGARRLHDREGER